MTEMFPVYRNIHMDMTQVQSHPEEVLIIAAPEDFHWVSWLREHITTSEDPVLTNIQVCVPAHPQAYLSHDFRNAFVRARRILFISTAAFDRVDSPHWQAFAYSRHQDPNGRQRRTIPVQVDDHNPSDLISTLGKIDLRGLDPEASAVVLTEQLSFAISDRQPRRQHPPAFPGKIT